MLTALVKGCVQLREISLCDCTHMTDENIHSLLFSMPHLESLTLSEHLTYNGELCGPIPATGSSLRFLSLIEFSVLYNKGLTSVLRRCGNLRAISLSSVPGITLTIIDSMMVNCPKLERMYLTHCNTRPYVLTKKRNTLKFNFTVEMVEPRIR